MHICHSDDNHYFNNPDATEILPRIEVTHEGKLYTKLTYAVSSRVEVKIKALARLLTLIKMIALTIFTGSIALAFQSVRKRLVDAIKGFVDSNVLRQEEIFIPRSHLENHGIMALLVSRLPTNKLLEMRLISTSFRLIVETTLINELNAGIITPRDLGISTVTELIRFFDENCSKITRLDLKRFSSVIDSDIEKISVSFPKLEELLIINCGITEASAPHFSKMTFLTTFSIEWCRKIKNFNFLQNCPNLTILNVAWCTNIKDYSFLSFCTHVTNLHLGGAKSEDLNFLPHNIKLKSLSLGGCRNVDEKHQINDFSFLEKCPNLTYLDLRECSYIKNVSFLRLCPNLEVLDLEECSSINDFSVLDHCIHLRKIWLGRCYNMNSLEFFRRCTNLEELYLDHCDRVSDISVLHSFDNLKTVSLYMCKAFGDTELQPLYDKGVRVII